MGVGSAWLPRLPLGYRGDYWGQGPGSLWSCHLLALVATLPAKPQSFLELQWGIPVLCFCSVVFEDQIASVPPPLLLRFQVWLSNLYSGICDMAGNCQVVTPGSALWRWIPFKVIVYKHYILSIGGSILSLLWWVLILNNSHISKVHISFHYYLEPGLSYFVFFLSFFPHSSVSGNRKIAWHWMLRK